MHQAWEVFELRTVRYENFDRRVTNNVVPGEVDVTALATLLFDTLAAMSMAMRRDNVGRVAAGDITWSQHAILAALIGNGPMRLSELAALERQKPPSTTTATVRMERKGWLTRAPDPSDHRAVLVAVTPQGVAAHRSSVESMQTRLAARLSTFTDTDLHHLKRAVHVLARMAEEQEPL
jgi:DNA-binding MarR family transcriptional regulator